MASDCDSSVVRCPLKFGALLRRADPEQAREIDLDCGHIFVGEPLGIRRFHAGSGKSDARAEHEDESVMILGRQFFTDQLTGIRRVVLESVWGI